MRRLGVTLGVGLGLVLLVTLGACSSDRPAAEEKPTAGSSSSSSSASATPAPVAPRVGACHRLTLDQATNPVDTSAAVPCGKAHTAVTFAVTPLPALDDGHLLAVDSPAVRARIATTCAPRLPGFLGGDQKTQRLSRLEAVWFTPSVEQADAGADWLRCDVVGLRREGALLELPAKMKGALDAPDALQKYGTCGTAAPGSRKFQRVACSERHSWQAVDVVDLPKGARYLAKGVAASGDAACKDVAAARANGALQYTWSFEWPTRAQWATGQRYGYCWVPAAG